MRSLRSEFIGSMRAWLPSRRSTAHQRGALVMRLVGQVRSGQLDGDLLVERARTSGTACPRAAGGGSSLHSLRLRFARCPAGQRQTPRRGGPGSGLVAAEKEEAHRSHAFTVCRWLAPRPPLGTVARILRPASQPACRSTDGVGARNRWGQAGSVESGSSDADGSSRKSAICSSGAGAPLVLLEDLELVVVRSSLRHVRLLAGSLGLGDTSGLNLAARQGVSGSGQSTEPGPRLASSAQFPPSGGGHSTGVCAPRCPDRCAMTGQNPRRCELLGVALPVLGHLDVQVEVHPLAEQLLDAGARVGADLAQAGAPASDDDRLLASRSTNTLTRTSSSGLSSGRPSRGTISSTTTARRVRQLVAHALERGLAHQLGDHHQLGLVGEDAVGVQRPATRGRCSSEHVATSSTWSPRVAEHGTIAVPSPAGRWR